MLKEMLEYVSTMIYPFIEETYENIRNSIRNKEYKTIRFYYALFMTILVYFAIMLYAICFLIVAIFGYCIGFIYGVVSDLFNKN